MPTWHCVLCASVSVWLFGRPSNNRYRMICIYSIVRMHHANQLTSPASLAWQPALQIICTSSQKSLHAPWAAAFAPLRSLPEPKGIIPILAGFDSINWLYCAHLSWCQVTLHMQLGTGACLYIRYLLIWIYAQLTRTLERVRVYGETQSHNCTHKSEQSSSFALCHMHYNTQYSAVVSAANRLYYEFERNLIAFELRLHRNKPTDWLICMSWCNFRRYSMLCDGRPDVLAVRKLLIKSVAFIVHCSLHPFKTD